MKKNKVAKILIGAAVALGIYGASDYGYQQYQIYKFSKAMEEASKEMEVEMAKAEAEQKAQELAEQKIENDRQTVINEMLQKATMKKVTDEFGDVEYVYTLVNDSKYDFEYLEMTYDELDANGVKINGNSDIIDNVKAGQSFQLKVQYLDENAASYKITGLTA